MDFKSWKNFFRKKIPAPQKEVPEPEVCFSEMLFNDVQKCAESSGPHLTVSGRGGVERIALASDSDVASGKGGTFFPGVSVNGVYAVVQGQHDTFFFCAEELFKFTVG